MDTNEVLNVASYAGRILLESGAETYRVEETMVKFCESFHVDEAQSFVTPTGVMLTIMKDSKNYTKVSRIQERGVDLHKIHEINDLSRMIRTSDMEIEQVARKLYEIDHGERYHFLTTLFFGALSAFGFAFFFAGTLQDALCAFAIGAAVKFVSMWMQNNGINVFFSNAIAASVASLLALICIHNQWSSSLDIVIISSIMLLVPGLAITNAIRDTVAGDYLAGIARATEAFLIAVAIAVGTGFCLQLWVLIMGGM